MIVCYLFYNAKLETIFDTIFDTKLDTIFDTKLETKLEVKLEIRYTYSVVKKLIFYRFLAYIFVTHFLNCHSFLDCLFSQWMLSVMCLFFFNFYEIYL